MEKVSPKSPEATTIKLKSFDIKECSAMASFMTKMENTHATITFIRAPLLMGRRVDVGQ